MVNYKTTKRLLQEDVDSMSLERLQQSKVRLMDAWRFLDLQYGVEESLKRGFVVCVLHEGSSVMNMGSSSGTETAPRDIWMRNKVDYMLSKIEERIKKLL